MQQNSGLSFRVQIVALILAIILPITAYSAFVVMRFAETQRHDDRMHNLGTARAISSAIDQQLRRAVETLATLAAAPELARGDLAGFYDEAAPAARRNDARIILTDRNGLQRLNTNYPFGTKLSTLRQTAPVEAAVATRLPQISDLITTATGDHQVAVYVPVPDGDEISGVVVMGFRPEGLSRIFNEQQVPNEWTVAVVDRKGHFVGRNRGLDQVLGKPVTGDLKDAMDAQGEGFATLRTKDDVEVYTAFTRSPLSGWTVAIGVPKSLIDAPLQRSLWEVVGGGLVLLAISASIAAWMARRIARSMRELADAALALGRAEELPPVRPRIDELQTVFDAMRTAATSLRQRVEEQRQAERALRKSEAHLRLAQQLGGVGSFERSDDRTVAQWSEETYRIFGVDPATFVPTRENYIALVHPDDRLYVAQHHDGLSAEMPRNTIEYRIVRPNGQIRIIRRTAIAILDESGVKRGFAGTLQDVTELHEAERRRRDLERRLEQTQRMEALGTLAGGIAHDLNNTMVPVIALAKALGRRAELGAAVQSQLLLIYEAGCRARDLVKQILAFSRKEVAAKQQVDLATFVNDALQMIRASVPSTVDIVYEPPQGLPPVSADTTQLYQVFINLVTNAVQAIGRKTGTISIALTLAEIEGERGFDAMPALRLTVRDTGCGIDRTIMDRIFDPFFTTKDVGEGTGLGLAVSHGIVVNHGGRIEVRSEPGHGSEFAVLLPAA